MRLFIFKSVLFCLVALGVAGEGYAKKKGSKVPKNYSGKVASQQKPVVSAPAASLPVGDKNAEPDIDKICSMLANTKPQQTNSLDAQPQQPDSVNLRKDIVSAFTGLFSAGIDSSPIVVPATQSALDTEIQLVNELNETRKKYGLSPLLIEADPTKATLLNLARNYSQRQDRREKLSHNLDGTTPSSRLDELNIPFSFVAENLAAGSGAKDIHETLLHSEGHCRNMLSPHSTYITIGVYLSPSGMYYATEIFRKP